MRNRVLILFVLSCSVFIFAFTSPRPYVYIVFYNESNKEVLVHVSITNTENTNTNKSISQTLKPGVQELEAGKFAKGGYSVFVEADKEPVSLTQRISLDTDRWLIITYTNNDSLSISKKYGIVDTTVLKKVNGMFTGFTMFSENRRPVNL